MRHVFIINPKAGKQDQTARIYAMADALRTRHGLTCECLLTSGPGGGTELARRAAESGEEVRLYACGGDGTIYEVANGIAGFHNAAMTCIPAGTGNDFLKNFGDQMPLFSDAENLWDGDVCTLDLIDCNGRLCTTIACNGIDAQVAESVHRYGDIPFLSGRGSYLCSVAANFLFKGIGHRWTVSLDGREETGEYALVSMCNGRYYGGDHDALPPELIRVSTAREVRIRAERDIVSCVDGECFRSREVVMTLSDKKLRFFGPGGCDPNATAR